MSQTTGKITLANLEQIQEIVRLLEVALPSREQLEELALHYGSDHESAQMLIDNADEIKAIRNSLANLIRQFSNINLYADQTVESSYGYLSGHRHARNIDEQIAELKTWIGPYLDSDFNWQLNQQQQALLIKPAPQESEGYFAVVFNRTMITHHEENPLIDQSCMVTMALNALNAQCKDGLQHVSTDDIGPRYYRRSKKSAQKLRKLWESQGCPTGIILIPAQLGLKYRGTSILRARVIIRGAEFPLDAFETLQMILTHRDRFSHYDDLWIDLPGGEYSPHANGIFNRALSLWFDGKNVGFSYRNIDCADGAYGSVSGFLPE